MKKSEKLAVKKAFGVPDPKRKEEFLAEYSLRLENSRRSPVPIFMRYAAVAAFAAVIISLCIIRLPSPDKEFSGSEVVTATETAVTGTAPEPTSADGMAVTGSDDETSSATTTAAATSGPENSDVTTNAKTVTTSASATSGTAASTTTSTKTTGSTTTSKRTTGTATTSRTSTTAKTTTTVTTTKEEDGAKSPLTSTPPVSTSVTSSEPPVTGVEPSHDYTVKPAIVYYPYDPEVSDGYPGFDPGVPPSEVPPGASSDTIVRGTVRRCYYTSFGDHTYTQIDISISEVFRSSYLHEYDLITVYIPGGFRADSRGGYVKNEYGFKPELYQEYLLMLNTAGSDLPSGTFVLSEPPEQSVFSFDYNEYAYISGYNDRIKYSNYAMKQFIL